MTEGGATLDASSLAETMTVYRDALVAHKEALNRLNVYPVPDGDTGTNMSLTLDSVVTEIATLDGSDPPASNGRAPAMEAVCKAVSHGSLMGARGNSGVILSQILRGLTDALKAVDEVGPEELATALVNGSDAAYGAVMRPVEGTILTVARATAQAARETAATGGALDDVLLAARIAGEDALAHTPDQLPVLAEAGVVDAGGAGFVLFVDSLLAVVAGRPLPEPPEEPDAAAAAAGPFDIATHGEPDRMEEPAGGAGDLRYEVMYLLEASDDAVEGFKAVWASIGDSIVVVGGSGLYNCHIHTDDIGAAVEAAMDVGRPRSIRITDLYEQVEQRGQLQEERWVREATSAQPADEEAEYHGPPVTCAAIAVANGPGVKRLFASLGVQRIVHGGQSMNPSTQDIVRAIEAAPATEVVVLPNNSNIVPVAQQATGLTEKKVVVVPTKGIPQALAALLSYDPDAPVEQNAESMARAAEGAIYGEVTRAVRDAPSEIGPIMEGDWIGLSARGIEVARGSLVDASCALLAHLVPEDAEVLTVIEGEGATGADTRRITVWLSDFRPKVEVEVHHGGQPLYPYLFGVD